MLRSAFQEFIYATNTDGSNKADSYIRALNMLGPILTKHYPKPIINGSMWHEFSVEELADIYAWLCTEARAARGGKEDVIKDFKSKSYLLKSFCSAAVLAYSKFMAVDSYENEIIKKVAGKKSGKEISKVAQGVVNETAQAGVGGYFGVPEQEGETRLATVKVRVNQNIFRKMILANYGSRCCLTGLSVPTILRASHISPWASDVENRLNPENGLCLAATYDAAFDKYLISFDEDYRMVLAPALKAFCQDEAFKRDFKSLEGKKIAMPSCFLPSQKFLEKHREQLVQ